MPETVATELVSTLALSGAGGVIGGTVAAVSRPMTRREVFFCIVGGLGIGTFLASGVAVHYGLPPMVAGGIGFVGGVSVFGVISGLQVFSSRWIASKTPPEQGGK